VLDNITVISRFSVQNGANNTVPKSEWIIVVVCMLIVMLPVLENTYTTHYESLDNLYDKTATQKSTTLSYEPRSPPSNKPHINNKLVDDDIEEEYMKMAPSRSCSHVTIKSETLRSADSIKMDTLGHHDNTLSSNYSHYDVPPSNRHHQPPGNSSHSNHNHYDIPKNNKLASTN